MKPVQLYRWDCEALREAPEHYGQTLGGWRLFSAGSMCVDEIFALEDPTCRECTEPLAVDEWPGDA
jgi:hypothetical protein